MILQDIWQAQSKSQVQIISWVHIPQNWKKWERQFLDWGKSLIPLAHGHPTDDI